jgi:predicted Zn-dependent peptidase
MSARTSLRRIAAALVAATPAVTLAIQQAPDRSRPPVPGPPPALHLPAVQKSTLSNGLPVWIIGVHKVPTVQLRLAVRAGSAMDPVKKFGLASLTADMLDEGAGARNALEIADAVDYLGADLSTSSGPDAAFVDLHVPVARLGDALPIIADVVSRPTFPEAELKRLREERLASLLQAQDDPEELIEFAFPRLLYGPAHRYGTVSMGTGAALKGFTIDDIKRFYASQYRPDNAALIVSGDVTPEVVAPLLERTLGTWKVAGTAAAPPPVAQAASPTATRVFLIDKPNAAQSQIRIGSVGVARSTPDYFAIRVLNTILGGSFTSRLNANLREQHGYAYGAASTFDMRLAAGPFYAAAGVQTDKTMEALKEFFNELRRIHGTVPANELERAKNYLAAALPHNFETTRSTAAALSQIFVYSLPDDFYATYGERVRAVTAADVKRAADTYIRPDKLIVVIIGDRKTIEPGVRSLNVGPVTIVDAADVMK